MKIAVVEDEEFWRERVQDEIRMFWRNEDTEIIIYASGEEFLENPDFYEIVFMDVELGGEDGLTAGRKYKRIYPESILIILTTHSEWCSKGYQAEAFRYLIKSNFKEEIQEALAGTELKLLQQKVLTFHVVSVCDVKLRCRDILYIETYKRNLVVHTVEKDYECAGNITEYAEIMKIFGFYHVHRSYLVNVEWIGDFTRKKVILKNDTEIDISIHRYNNFKVFFFNWKMNQGNG